MTTPDPSQAPAPRIPGALFVWVSILIFAAANSVVALLVDIGSAHPIEGRNAISYCNVLFVGNLCAFVMLGLLYRKQWTRENLAALDWTDWASLLVLALLSSALAPALTFTALSSTSVTNVVLVGRIEPPLYLLLSILFLKEKLDPWTLAGNLLSLIGVGSILWLEGGGMLEIGRGEACAGLGAIVLAVSTIISKQRLGRIPLGIFTVFRTGMGAVIFFFAALHFYGPSHFQDAFTPLLWKWMLVYGAVVVVGGQICWFQGIKTSNAGSVSIASSFSPVAGVLFAFVLLSETPGRAQWIGGSIILLGIGVSQVGRLFQKKPQPPVAETQLHHEGELGFKGV
jgi:drug/metabolite transporter (DMT)-like permease